MVLTNCFCGCLLVLAKHGKTFVVVGLLGKTAHPTSKAVADGMTRKETLRQKGLFGAQGKSH